MISGSPERGLLVPCSPGYLASCFYALAPRLAGHQDLGPPGTVVRLFQAASAAVVGVMDLGGKGRALCESQ